MIIFLLVYNKLSINTSYFQSVNQIILKKSMHNKSIADKEVDQNYEEKGLGKICYLYTKKII